jgi:hypothetical protein
MTSRTNIAIAVLAAVTFGVVASVAAQGDKVAFREAYAKDVLYWVQDRPNTNNPANSQIREYYTSAAAVAAAKAGQPMPHGTVITVVQYGVQLDAQGQPVKDANGRLIKTSEIRGYTAMEKRAGWGEQYAADKRNGEWEYQAFRADRTANAMADLNTCFTCHKKVESADFVFSLDQLKAAK